MYYVMHSTVTNIKIGRLLGITSIIKNQNYENFKQQSIIKYFTNN